MRYLLIFCCHFLIVATVHATPEADSFTQSLVTMTIEFGSSKVTQSGFVIGDGNSIVSFLEDEKTPSRIFVKANWSGGELLASVFERSPLGILIVSVPGLNGEPLTFTKTSVAAGQIIYSFEYQSRLIKLVKGAVSKKINWQKQEGVFVKSPVGPVHHLFIHNALLTDKSVGAPILDACSRVVGMNRMAPNNLGSQDKLLLEYALNAPQLITELNSIGAKLVVDNTDCLSLEEQAVQKEKEKQVALKKAEEVATEKQVKEAELKTAKDKLVEAEAKSSKAKNKLKIAEEKLSVANKQAELSEQAKQQLQANIEQARIEFERTQSEIKAVQNRQKILVKKLSAKEKQAEQERMHNKEMLRRYAIIATAILLSVILIVVIFSRRRQGQFQVAKKEAENRVKEAEALAKRAEKHRAPFDCLLNGEDESGNRYFIKIDRQILGKAEGVILGRNPNDANYVVENEEISRANTRLYMQGAVLFVEDLESSNGTSVDGALLPSKSSAKIVSGTELSIGPVHFKVTLDK